MPVNHASWLVVTNMFTNYVDSAIFNAHHFVHRQGVAGDRLVNRNPPLLLKVGKFKWKNTFSGGNFPISTVFCNSLSVPNVSQTCELFKNTLIRPGGPYKLIFKNKNQIYALSTVPYVSHCPLTMCFLF